MSSPWLPSSPVSLTPWLAIWAATLLLTNNPWYIVPGILLVESTSNHHSTFYPHSLCLSLYTLSTGYEPFVLSCEPCPCLLPLHSRDISLSYLILSYPISPIGYLGYSNYLALDPRQNPYITMSLSKLSKASQNDVYHCKYGDVIRLTHNTYPQWSRDLTDLLQATGALEIALGAEAQLPPNPASRLTDYQKRFGLGVSFIYNSCGPEAKTVLQRIARSPQVMWDTPKAEFDSTASRAGREGLVREFNSIKPTSYDTVGAYITALLDYKNMLAPTDQAISDATFISRLTSSLPDAYDPTIQLLHQQPDTSVSKYITTIKQYKSTLRLKANATNLNSASTSGAALHAGVSTGSHWRGR